MKTLQELKNSMQNQGQYLAKLEGELIAMVDDSTNPSDKIESQQKLINDTRMRFEILKEQHDKLEAEQKAKFDNEKNLLDLDSPEEQKMKAKADMIKAVMANKPVPSDVRQALGDGNSSGGEKFLPKTVSNDVIVEPLVKNQLRSLSTFTQVTNLELPKINFTLDDDDFIEDTETAKELEVTGDTVTFGRNKFKVFAGVSETVLLGTNANIVTHVENALQSGVAAKERKVAFAEEPKTGEEHMSFYANDIKEVEGEDHYKAIKKAIADLHEDYRENATIVMRYADYMEIIEVLANGNATLYSAQPEQVLGKPVVFIDSAVTPIVGDFAYSHFNYDIATTQYERDKDIKTGIEQFVVTAWFDHQIKLASAFRIAKIEEETP